MSWREANHRSNDFFAFAAFVRVSNADANPTKRSSADHGLILKINAHNVIRVLFRVHYTPIKL
jgi:hypothetical protein